MERLGHDLSGYSNPQASVQMVLKRMVDSREVEEQANSEGKKEYRMRTPSWARGTLAKMMAEQREKK